MSRAPRDPVTAFLRGAFEGWLDGRRPFEELHLCDEDDQVRVELVGPIAGEDVPAVGAVVRAVSEMGAAPRRAGRRAVKELRDQMTQKGEGHGGAEGADADSEGRGSQATTTTAEETVYGDPWRSLPR